MLSHIDLKSNMDRFIEKAEKQVVDVSVDLKSNMDRFIAVQKYNLLDKQII